ncbi:hypothetical protein A1C_04335 [Rickettsia akari str. Hartford]|uniref:Uncharacterized protein n=1 Tax=Rickettsia akari (strain Hartford) TaxID=293614 RepID=A8GP14_RICAH|nr:hypothetical protein [Rickettsia akari]ABV75139.1 hypothetical protein A1C_04335 [Rickettsia akari str. Hartford]
MLLSLSVVAYDVVKETLEVREDKYLDKEKKTLENIKANYVKQAELVVAIQIDKGKDSPALKNFLGTKLPKIDQLSEWQLREYFNVTRGKVVETPEFAPLAEKTNFAKVKSAVTAGAGCLVESQVGDLKEIYGKKEEQKSSTVFITPNIQKHKTPAIAKAAEKVHHMQESLMHGKVTARSNNISPLLTGRSASKKQESSR